MSDEPTPSLPTGTMTLAPSPTGGDLQRPRFVLGVGASAGGLEALGRFFAAMPPGLGIACVVIQHLSPHHKSYMAELLARKSRLDVVSAEDGALLRPDHVHVLPPRKTLSLAGDMLVLKDIPTERGLHMPIDSFFQSLAEAWKENAIAVVLSGTGSDGTLGVRAIKEQGGMVMVQSEASAEFDGMPHSAISTGLADFIATPDELPALLQRFVQHPLAGHQERSEWRPQPAQSDLQLIFEQLRDRTGIDFSAYKANTIHRRIARRMSVQQVDSLQAYARLLVRSEQETDVLFNDLLICVTRFLRDREMWQKLEDDVLPDLLRGKGPAETVRAWVPGCATGEEAYSLAMVLLETMERCGQQRDFKIFATDVSAESLEQASQGRYSHSALVDVPPAWLERYFVPAGDGYQVNATVRRKVVFARHDLISAPPFMHMDLISCRNLLIYLLPNLQARVLSHFGVGLNPGGVLVLGSSETTGETAHFLTPVSTRHRIFRRQEAQGFRGLLASDGSSAAPLLPPFFGRAGRSGAPAEARVTQDLVARELVKTFAPPSFVVNERKELLHVFGRGGDYLKHPDGALSNNILQLTSRSIGAALGPALSRVMRDGQEFVYENVELTPDTTHQVARLRVRPLNLPANSDPLYLVVIEEVREATGPVPGAEDFQADRSATQRIRALEEELAYTRENLQSTTEELEASNEELQASNEELIASNEELQSTNEELQSVNEELHSVNAESQRRIDEVLSLSNDLGNIFTVAQMGAILLSADLRMRRLASAVFTLTGLSQTDIGAPVEVLSRQLECEGIVPLVRRSVQQGQTEELEVLAPSGSTLLLRSTPYVNEQGVNDGAVLTLLDISARKTTLNQLLQSEHLLRAALNALPCHVAIVDADGTITLVNEAWDRFTLENGGLPGKSCGVGSNYFTACRNASGPFGEEAQAVLTGLQETLKGQRNFFETVYPCHSPHGQRWFRMQASRLPQQLGGLVVSHTLLEAPSA